MTRQIAPADDPQNSLEGRETGPPDGHRDAGRMDSPAETRLHEAPKMRIPLLDGGASVKDVPVLKCQGCARPFGRSGCFNDPTMEAGPPPGF